MIGAVRAARAGGVKTGLISNSWGLGIYDRAPGRPLRRDGDLGRRRPSQAAAGDLPLACERLGVESADCVFVDDLRENITGAEAVGMTAILHRDSAATVAKLEDLLGLSLSAV